MSFLYFIPGVFPQANIRSPKELRTVLANAGLGYLGIRELSEVVLTEVDRTVDGSRVRGTIVVRKINGTNPAVDNFGPGQAWIHCGKHQVGCSVESPPTPQELARETISTGYLITDSSNNAWVVPVARSPIDANVTLPRDWVFDLETGVATAVSKPEYDWLWELTGKLHDHHYGDVRMDGAAMAASAAKILSVNYAIGPAELNLLRVVGRSVLDTKTVRLITLYCLDDPLLDEQKKKAVPDVTGDHPDGSPSSTPGDSADSPTTAPAGRN